MTSPSTRWVNSKRACCAWCATAMPTCWKSLRTKKEGTDEIGDKLKAVVDDYAKAFAA